VGFEGHRPYYKDSACSSPLLLIHDVFKQQTTEAI
jgi:hypothetical protein